MLVVLALCGCEKAQDVVDKLKPATLERFAVYQAAVAKALANPVDTPPSLPEKLVFPGGKGRANAQIIHAEWVQIPVVHVEDEIVMEAGSSFVEVRNLCHGSYPSDGGDPDYYRSKFEEFNGIKYLVLVSGDVAAATVGNSSYTGSFGGRLAIVDVDKQVSLGSIPLVSGMSDKVKVVLNHEHSVERQLEWDAKEHARKAVATALAPYLAPDSGAL